MLKLRVNIDHFVQIKNGEWAGRSGARAKSFFIIFLKQIGAHGFK